MQIRLKDFSRCPGGRSRKSGLCSAEEFYENILEPSFIKVLITGEKLTVDLDGTAGIASSFLDEAFGSLTLNFDQSSIYDQLEIISTEEMDYAENVWESIEEWIRDGIHYNSPQFNG